MAKFPFWGMDYSPWSSKNLIDRNRLKKFMQVGVDVKCMHTDIGGRGLSGFGDKISIWSIKVEKFNRSESAQKIHATKVHLRSPEPSFYCYNFAPTGPIGKIQAPIGSSSNAAAIGIQKSLLQFLYLVAVLEMAYF